MNGEQRLGVLAGDRLKTVKGFGVRIGLLRCGRRVPSCPGSATSGRCSKTKFSPEIHYPANVAGWPVVGMLALCLAAGVSFAQGCRLSITHGTKQA